MWFVIPFFCFLQWHVVCGCDPVGLTLTLYLFPSNLQYKNLALGSWILEPPPLDSTESESYFLCGRRAVLSACPSVVWVNRRKWVTSHRVNHPLESRGWSHILRLQACHIQAAFHLYHGQALKVYRWVGRCCKMTVVAVVAVMAPMSRQSSMMMMLPWWILQTRRLTVTPPLQAQLVCSIRVQSGRVSGFGGLWVCEPNHKIKMINDLGVLCFWCFWTPLALTTLATLGPMLLLSRVLFRWGCRSPCSHSASRSQRISDRDCHVSFFGHDDMMHLLCPSDSCVERFVHNLIIFFVVLVLYWNYWNIVFIIYIV